MKQPIRYFSIGLIFSGILLFIAYTFFDEPEAALDDIDIDTLIATVKDNGYHVMAESEYIRLSLLQDSINEEEEDPDKDADKNQEASDSDESIDDEEEETEEEIEEDTEDEAEEETEEEVVEEEEESTTITYTITIEENMLPSDVTAILENQQIISDARAFNQFLEDEEYSRYIQIGTFEVSSDMSDHELAQALTR